ncbi:MAG: CubicO group peptidase (beta-lactamase class C family) [Cyclobacteriaceae bacterium]|jgi:CubicO group peptidase (beta-lactamase class C family)
MSYKTILLILLFLISQNISWGQAKEDSLYKNLELEIGFIIEHAILHEAFPGCVVYASQAGKPILFKSYGFHTYDSLIPVLDSDIYDIASITKVAASTLALMKLYELGKFELDEPINKYIQHLGMSKVGEVTFRQALAHQGGMQSWIKFYEKISRKNGHYKRNTIKSAFSSDYPYQLSEGMFLYKDFDQRIKKYIRRSEVNLKQGYVYSGLFFYMVPELVKTLSGKDFPSFLNDHFYTPMALSTIGFNPLDKFDPSMIVPTEVDTFFRNENIHGKVHDEGAILMKGISGNAGLFSNASDLGRLWQMFLNDGTLDSIIYLKPSTIDLFTAYQYANLDNRRGLGFDKPLLEYDSIKSSIAKSASTESYGHTGFTGTLVWADPQNDLLFIFLSNRVYPNRGNKSIYELNIRPEIHQKIYDYLDHIQN